MNDKEFSSCNLLKLKYRRGGQIIQAFCRRGSPQKISFPLFILWKFEKSEKSSPGSCRMPWNLMNDKEFGSLKLLKLKYRKGGHMIQQFWRIGFPQEIRSPLLNFKKFCKTWEVLLNPVESNQILWMTKNLGRSTF